MKLATSYAIEVEILPSLLLKLLDDYMKSNKKQAFVRNEILSGTD